VYDWLEIRRLADLLVLHGCVQKSDQNISTAASMAKFVLLAAGSGGGGGYKHSRYFSYSGECEAQCNK